MIYLDIYRIYLAHANNEKEYKDFSKVQIIEDDNNLKTSQDMFIDDIKNQSTNSNVKYFNKQHTEIFKKKKIKNKDLNDILNNTEENINTNKSYKKELSLIVYKKQICYIESVLIILPCVNMTIWTLRF